MLTVLEAKLYDEGRKRGYTGDLLDRYVFGTLAKIKKKHNKKPIRKRKARGSKK